MRLAVSSDGKSFDKPQTIQTPKDYRKGLEVFKNYSKKLETAGKLKAVVGGIAGPLNKEKTMTAKPPNLPGWRKKPLKKI